jgi:hypothetical protein
MQGAAGAALTHWHDEAPQRRPAPDGATWPRSGCYAWDTGAAAGVVAGGSSSSTDWLQGLVPMAPEELERVGTADRLREGAIGGSAAAPHASILACAAVPPSLPPAAHAWPGAPRPVPTAGAAHACSPGSSGSPALAPVAEQEWQEELAAGEDADGDAAGKDAGGHAAGKDADDDAAGNSGET